MVIVDFYSVHNEIFILNLSNLRRGVFFYRKQNTTTRIQKKNTFQNKFNWDIANHPLHKHQQ